MDTLTIHTTAALQQADQQHYLPVFRRYPLAFARGEGARLYTPEGKVYLDALAGIAVNNVGHSHPVLVQAIQEQAARLIHISNFYVSAPQVHLAAALTELSGLERVFLTNSGTESIEGAIKLARKYAGKQGRGSTIVTMQGAFHGRTLAALAATGKAEMMNPFGPVPGGFLQVPFNDLDALLPHLTSDVAAVLLEPIQGEGGVRLADRDYLWAVRQHCQERGILLIFDEIQTGMGRTGQWFAHQQHGVKPDLMTLAKALGGGVPIGAVLASEQVAAAIDWGDHGTTFGGNPLASAAALATIGILRDEGLLAKAREKGAWLMKYLQRANHPHIREVRGQGLMVGVELTREAKPVVARMLEHGVLANATAGNVVRLVPPLVITAAELEQVAEVLLQSIHETQNQ